MPKNARKTHDLFGAGGSTDNFAIFGSEVNGTPTKTKDIVAIQSLPAWTGGLQMAIYGANKAILLEDLNGWLYEHSYQVAYIFQEGVPEWDSATTYWKGSWAKTLDGSGQIYISQADNNTGNTLPVYPASNANWVPLVPPAPPTNVPTGAILPFAGTAIPAGFLACDGQAYASTSYPALYALIGTTWGNGGGGAGQFNVPDLRGVFLRGANSMGTGPGDATDSFADPDKAARVARKAGGATGDNVGSFQQDQIVSHTHTGGFAGPSPGAAGGPGISQSLTGATGGNETRAKNAYVVFIIKT